ncbi:hypothetical protein DXB46_15760 [Lachnospiraceae bacterium OM04-12BH]|nr:hypothetical protein DXB46_15760 [Lachnospiraceae bacterium OM04-12BH]
MSIQPDASLTAIGLAAPISTAVGIVLNVGFYIYLNRKSATVFNKTRQNGVLSRNKSTTKGVMKLLVFLPYSFTRLHFTVPLSCWICLHNSYYAPK